MANRRLGLFKFRFKAMGTLCELQCYVGSEAEGKAVSDKVQADVDRLEQRYSRYRDDSFLSAINRAAAAGAEIAVDAETAGLLDYAATCFHSSDGLFDITSGILRKVWKFDGERLPAQAAIDELLARVGWQKLVWQAPRLAFPLPGMELDLGGVVKEYAADRAAVICQDSGVRHGLVNLGGDIRIVGPHPDGSPWVITIQHPREQDAGLMNLELFGGGLASSGDYQRCIVIDGQRYSHIINPKTGWPARRMASVSVVGNFCLIAGSASTIGMLKEDAAEAWLTELGLPCVWMDNDGKVGCLQ